jgi:hypothetical protein
LAEYRRGLLHPFGRAYDRDFILSVRSDRMEKVFNSRIVVSKRCKLTADDDCNGGENKLTRRRVERTMEMLAACLVSGSYKAG